MPINWITKDGRRIPLNSGGKFSSQRIERFELQKFVNLNAACPVCQQKVVYYQNSNGSRVFFDDLGWPWEKHECTDNRQRNAHIRDKSRMFSQSIMLHDGRQLAALSNGYLVGYYDENDESKSFALLRLRTSRATVIYVECAYRENGIFWDELEKAPFFFWEKSCSAHDFMLWFFSPIDNEGRSDIRMIVVRRTTIPFEDCVRAFRRS